ncbi:hypothetical protein CYLTODRAFT_426004 [Cylindrobasidium torrendii FP15055 ss-10]|uniref:SnoaL-like domain-containing protein n=1 Tax=Cylindrobasidium torrendii FP15055 ss-10 TaxID=1314674 RepID=A0A0D7B0A3_9AGAR|nr:hypothetical protein CYLTODRAFT_426004 [Cylindrobasidium torrendii FP15055 ss-10]
MPTAHPHSVKSTIWHPPAHPSASLLLVLNFLAHLERLDTGSLQMYMHPSFEHWYLPKSLNRPRLNGKQYEEYWGYLCKVYETFAIEIHSVIEAAEAIVVHLTIIADSTTGAHLIGENTMTFRFAQDDWGLPQFITMEQFVDSAKVLEFFKEHSDREKALKEKKRAKTMR